jgi:hypothetical protein
VEGVRVFNILKKLFERKIDEADPGSEQPSLRDMDIFIFAAIDGDGIAAGELTQENLIEQIRKGAESLGKRESFAPFIYEAKGQRRLPFFTSQNYAEIFAGEYSRQHDRVYPFQLLGVKGAVLIDCLGACDVLVMNDSASDEVEIPVRHPEP